MPTIPYKYLKESDNVFYPVVGASSVEGQIPVSSGGTGASTALAARENIGAISAENVTSGVQPGNFVLSINEGGTGANTAEGASSNLGFDEGSGYVKFPNGTLIQWGSFSVGPVDVTASWGQLFESSGISVNETFNEPFYSSPQLTYRCRASGVQVLLEDATYVSTTGITGTVYLYRPTASLSVSATISWMAIGRWKA